ncbi:radical SAM protein [Paenibacillus sp. HN-1]|uniref:radical SAM protein n=1 Tax=Paenibacillus TaxID=44249 RepID=UPI001CA9D3CD|nr:MULTISPECIES: radical SAM protein [Paenibacillus]MBY9080761.1 radical SAM protein [Paenibacillus sp. CGMCC 1.18879]MBY9085247.1 radical SAM protein [Paenibacillus sinensis]
MNVFVERVFESNISKMKKMLKYYHKRHLFRDGTPLVMSFLTTNRCFLKCKHCFYYETLSSEGMTRDPRELTLDDYEKISKSMEWFFMGIFTGGEPFIREDLHEIIHLFRTNNMMSWCDSATNGVLTDGIVKQTELICKQDPEKHFSLSFSIDGFENESDELRGKGTFRRSIETLEACKALRKKYNNLELNLCSTFNTINQDSYAEFINWFIKTHEPNKVTILKVRQTPRAGRYLCDVDLDLFAKAVDQLGDHIASGNLGDLNSPQTHFTHQMSRNTLETIRTSQRNFVCYAGKHGGWVDYNGDVSVCEVLPDAKTSGNDYLIGNLSDYNMDFMELWNSPKAYAIKQNVGKLPVCKGCTHETEGQIPSLYFEPNEFAVNKKSLCRS